MKINCPYQMMCKGRYKSWGIKAIYDSQKMCANKPVGFVYVSTSYFQSVHCVS